MMARKSDTDNIRLLVATIVLILLALGAVRVVVPLIVYVVDYKQQHPLFKKDGE